MFGHILAVPFAPHVLYVVLHIKAGDSVAKALPAFVLAAIAIVLAVVNADSLGHPFS